MPHRTETLNPMENTIHGLQKHFAELYELRNHFVNGSFGERTTHMNRRIGRIADAKRKNEKMPGRLARAFSYFMSCVNYFGTSLDLELGMMEKFPSHGCLYCHRLPCKCEEGRPDPAEYSLNEEQRKWPLSRWQSHLQQVYGHFNTDKFEKVFMRLTSEFGEFGILNAHGPHTPITPSGIMQECRREAADVFSWILTLAYVEHINLEREVIQRYVTCPGCRRSSECECPLVFISEDGRQFSTVGTPAFTHIQK